MEPAVGLIRGFVVDFFNRHDASACRRLMAPDYALRVGDLVMSGRDEQYVPAVQGQFDRFPGLGMTVHDLVVSGNRIALHFSEHGASGGPGGPCAAWSGVALYRSDGVRLTGCVAEEDYFARRRQLTTGAVDPIDPPMPAPWDTASQPADPDAEEVVSRWLAGGGATGIDGVLRDDEHLGLSPPLVVDVTETVITEIFSAGSHVAFHARQIGRCIAGLPAASPMAGPVVLSSAGIVSVVDGSVRRGRMIRDRAGMQRSLLAP